MRHMRSLVTVCLIVAISTALLLLNADGGRGGTSYGTGLPVSGYGAEMRSAINNNASVDHGCYQLRASWTMRAHSRLGVDCRKHFPRVFLIGARGCGTDVVRNLLAVHPEVAVSLEEVDFFSTKYYKDMAWYFDRMPHSKDDQVTLDHSPGYLTYPGTAERIAGALDKRVQIVALLCEPIKRALYDYQRTANPPDVRFEEEKRPLTLKKARDKVELKNAWEKFAQSNPSQYLRKDTFAKTVLNASGNVVTESLYVDIGIYAKHLLPWLRFFPRQNILALRTDADVILTDPVPVLSKLERFLGISKYFKQDHFYLDESTGLHCLMKPFKVCLGPNNRGRPNDLSREVRRKLEDFYLPHNVHLTRLLKGNID